MRFSYQERRQHELLLIGPQFQFDPGHFLGLANCSRTRRQATKDQLCLRSRGAGPISSPWPDVADNDGAHVGRSTVASDWPAATINVIGTIVARNRRTASVWSCACALETKLPGTENQNNRRWDGTIKARPWSSLSPFARSS
jgi:hypothetical protein